MKLLSETCMGLGNPAFIGKRQQHLTGSAATEMVFEAQKENEKAGMLIFQSEYNFYYICQSIKDGKQVVQLYKGNQKTKAMDLITEAPLEAKKVQFKIEAQREFYSFYYTDNQGKWKLLKDKVDGKLVSTQTAGGFVGALYALYATSSGQASQNKAMFKWLDYTGNDAVHAKK